MRYGLIGKNLMHSQSSQLFKNHFGDKYTYQLFELESIEKINELLQTYTDLLGFNVTIPYKKSIIPYIQQIDTIASQIGAVNTVSVKRDIHPYTLIGFNTDATGFEKAYSSILNKKHSLALILGTGGASRAVSYILKQYHIPFLQVSRSKSSNNIISYTALKKLSQPVSLIINTTPVGMYPNINDMPNVPEKLFIHTPTIIDIIYNPAETKLLNEAKKYNCPVLNGTNMLTYQAQEAWKIWHLE